MPAVPTIDLLLAESDAAERTRLDAACRDHGFFLLANHGMQPQIDVMWEASRQFFDQPGATKRQVMRSQESALGYYDRELTKRRRDLKEVFDFLPQREEGKDPNKWPSTPPGFKAAMHEFTEAAGTLAARTLNLVFASLGADAPDLALPQGQHRTSNVRLNYYPVNDPLDASEQSAVTDLGDMALHHHTDPGILTLLVQDAIGGLQTESGEHGWIDVAPVPGTIVVNLGDAMQVWSNDTYRAAVHRVLPMAGQARYSTPYFYNPTSNATLEPLAALGQGQPHYRPFTWREFIQARMDDNFADLGAEDTQIAHYRIA